MEARETVTVKSCQQAQSTSIIRWTITNVVTGVNLVEGGNEIEGGKNPFMRAGEKGFQGELTVL